MSGDECRLITQPVAHARFTTGARQTSDTPRAPPTRHVYQVISTPRFFLPHSPHVSRPLFFALCRSGCGVSPALLSLPCASFSVCVAIVGMDEIWLPDPDDYEEYVREWWQD